MVYGLSCSVVCGIFQDQGSNLGLLHWQADSLLQSHLGSPVHYFLIIEVLHDTEVDRMVDKVEEIDSPQSL